MDENMQNQMSAILNDPAMMQKIMSMAQTLKAPEASAQQPQKEPAAPAAAFPDIDLSMVQKLSGLAGKSNIDSNQRSLLSALTPYLSRERVQKLERAMRAAKMANLASAFLGRSNGR